MKRVCLLLAFVLFCCSLTGCDDPEREDYKRLDEDKAAEVALSYMNDKYDETFYVVKSEKDAAHGYVPGSIQDAWVDVTVAIAGDEAAKKYAVRLRMNADKEHYDINCDSYMTSLVTPWAKMEMDAIISALQIPEYFTGLSWRWKQDVIGVSSDFPILQDNSSLKDVAGKQEMDFDYCIYLPESAYTADIKENVKARIKPVFSEDDNVAITIVAYTDEYYLEFKKALAAGGKAPPGLLANEKQCDKIYLY